MGPSSGGAGGGSGHARFRAVRQRRVYPGGGTTQRGTLGFGAERRGRGGWGSRGPLSLGLRIMAIDPNVRIGRIHLKVADLERALGVLLRGAGVRVDAAVRAGSGVGRRGWVSPSHRAEHVGEPRRFAPAAGEHGAVPRGDPVPDAGGAGGCGAAGAGGGDRAGWGGGPRGERGAASAGPGWERDRAVLGPRGTSGRGGRMGAWRCARGRWMCRGCCGRRRGSRDKGAIGPRVGSGGGGGG